MSTLTKKQHYVWAHHLRAWEVDGSVWCHRQAEDKLFRTNSRSLANETFFYRNQELTREDLAVLEHLITRSNSPRNQEINRGWIRNNQISFLTRRLLAVSPLPPDERAKILDHLDVYEKTAIERWHGRVENNFQDGLEELREGRADFYADQSARNAFITFLAFQYFRTASMRGRMLGVMKPIAGYDPQRTWNVEALIFSTNVGASLAREQSAYQIGFLENQTNAPLITADQPVINILRDGSDDLMFYFPVSPARAIVFGPKRHVGAARRDLSQFEVEQRNHEMFCRSGDQTYADDRGYLQAIVKLGKTAAA